MLGISLEGISEVPNLPNRIKKSSEEKKISEMMYFMSNVFQFEELFTSKAENIIFGLRQKIMLFLRFHQYEIENVFDLCSHNFSLIWDLNVKAIKS